MQDGLGYEGVALLIYVVALAILYALRRPLGAFWSALAFLGATCLYLVKGFEPSIPASAQAIYLACLIAAVLLYITSSESAAQAFWKPLRDTMVEPARLPLLGLAMIGIPLVVGYAAYAASLPSPAPPPKVRTVHPAPPAQIQVQRAGLDPHPVTIVGGANPLRELERRDPAAFAETVARGKVVYYENCFFCHGDTLAADGHFAAAVKPPPANFQDQGITAQFTETYFFWRVAKGGPGLPPEATPFDSSMPVWEDFLSEEDMWAALLFLYDYTGYEPRAEEAVHGDGGAH